MVPTSTTAAAVSTTPAAADWRTVRCENDRCRRIVFRYRRDDEYPSGGVVLEVKCRCKTMNQIRIVRKGTTH